MAKMHPKNRCELTAAQYSELGAEKLQGGAIRKESYSGLGLAQIATECYEAHSAVAQQPSPN